MRLSKGYLTILGCKDVVRSPGTFIASAFVVAGICLPLLLLIALNRGLVKQMLDNINKSPTAREIQLWVMRENNALTDDSMASLMERYPTIETVIPTVKKVVKLTNGQGSGPSIDGLTLKTTDELDASLKTYGVDIPEANEQAVILTEYVADILDVNIGDAVQLEVMREEGSQMGLAQVDLIVKDINDLGSRQASIGYAHWRWLEHIERYQMGEAVPEFGWPSFQRPIDPRYSCFLGFTRDELTKMDEVRLKAKGLRAELLPQTDPNDQRLNLFGLLGSQAPPYVYKIGANTDKEVSLDFASAEIERILDADLVAVPWNEPIELELEGRTRQLVGLSLRPRWLRERFVSSQSWFETDKSECQVILAQDVNTPDAAKTLDLKLEDSFSIPVSVQYSLSLSDVNVFEPTPMPVPKDSNSPIAGQLLSDPNDPNQMTTEPNEVNVTEPNQVNVTEPNQVNVAEPVQTADSAVQHSNQTTTEKPPHFAKLAVVPSSLLSHIHQFRAGKARFERDARMFVRPRSEINYFQARIYARTLDDVLALDEELSTVFSVYSEKKVILEMKGYERTLTLLVSVVGGVVFIFGLATVTSLLSDISARKKGDIGILSCMGISKGATIYFVIIRATMIAILGCLIAYLLSIVISFGLNKFDVKCSAPVRDLVWLLPFSILCCWTGAIVPAIRAALLDPVKCLQEARGG